MDITELNLQQILDTGAKCSNLTKKQKKEIDEAIKQRGLSDKQLSLGAKIHILRNDIKEIPKCEACSKELTFAKSVAKFLTFCSTKCSANSKETVTKRQQTNLIKYGSTNVLRSDSVIKQTEEKMLLKHGVKTFLESDEYKQRFASGDIMRKSNPELNRQRMLEWSFANVLPNFKNKVIPLFTLEDYTGGGSGKHYPWECVRCKSVFHNYYVRQKNTWPKCPKCDAAYTDIEYAVINFLATKNIPCKLRDRKTIPNRELDIYIPEKNLAIELNGLYYHSEKKLDDINYHIKKTKLCRSKNIDLIQIFADEIYYKKQLCISKIKNRLGINRKISASECTIKPIDGCTNFLTKYTFRGELPANTKLGAFYKNKLVGVMTFNGDIICQFATLYSFEITNLFDVFVAFYTKEFLQSELNYFADIRWEPCLTKPNFDLVDVDCPKCWGTKNFLTRFEVSEEESNVLFEDYELGYTRIWDCGYNHFKIKIDQTTS